MKRRTFITGLGSATAWPLATRAQQTDRMRRIGVLLGTVEDDSDTKARLMAFRQGLAELGWTEGRNVRIDRRFAAGERDILPRYVAELLSLKPDVVLAQGGGIAGLFQQASRAVPIVFAEVTDPVAGGLIENLARPGTNATGLTLFEYGLAAKWLELLKQIAPDTKRVGVLRDPAQLTAGGQLGGIQAVAPSLGVEAIPLDVRQSAVIERSIAAFADRPNSGLIVLASFLAYVHREQIVALAARYRLPTVYPARLFVAAGGLVSYGPDNIEQFRLAAGYVDRILKGESPADLPVRTPTRYETALNLRTAKMLNIEVPTAILLRADEVIE